MRWCLWAGLVLAAGQLGCAPVKCGAGTIQVQTPDGELSCAPTEADAPQIPCDADGGAEIKAGRCISRVQCGPNTTFDPASGLCVGTGSGPSVACKPPAAGKICVQGTVRRFTDGQPITSELVKVAAYNPFVLLTDPNGAPVVPAADPVNGASYAFADIDPAATNGRLVLRVSDPSGTAMDMRQYQVTACGAGGTGSLTAGQIYTIDTYVLPRSVVAGWSQQAGDVDYDVTGAYVARFFADKLTSPTELTATEKTPVSGVVLKGSKGTPAKTYYFGPDLVTLDPSLTATAASGTAITPGTGAADTYTGMGGLDPVSMAPISWGAPHLAAAAGGVVFVDRFHAQ